MCGAPRWIWLSLLGLFTSVSLASADASHDSYEQLRLQQHLDAQQLRVDPAAEGKRVRRVMIVRREVFEGDDLRVPVVLPSFATTWPNWFHHLSEDETIRREVLLDEGAPFSGELAEESMRNLRGLGIFALVRIVPVATDEPDRVDVLVYTRDLWSLRLEQEFAGAGKTFSLSTQLVERNFLGRNKQLAGRFDIVPDTYTFGQTYIDPRVAGAELRLVEQFDVIFNRARGSPEGTAGLFRFGRPFYTLAQRFSFEIYAQYADYVARRLADGDLLGFNPEPGQGNDACTPGVGECLGRAWDQFVLRVDLAVHHRIGEQYKQTFTAGAGAFDRHGSPNAETRLRPGRAATSWLAFRREVLPLSRRDVYPYVRYRLSLPRFAVFTNLGTFGQSETVQLGPRLDSSIATPLRALGSHHDGMLVRGTAGYTLAGADALLDLLADATSRLDGGNVIDQRLTLQLRAASPSYRAIFGRLVLRWLWEFRHNDSQNTYVTLGGDNGLRGYPAQRLHGTGANRALVNLEYRTRPLLIQSVHVGAVAFYDVGTVYPASPQSQVLHGVGAGLRVLLPQFNRYAFRLDAGVAVGEPGFSVLLSWGGDQAIPLTPAEDLIAESGIGLNLNQ